MVLSSYRPKLRQAENQSVQAESQAQAYAIQEREQDPQLADVKWLARPTHPTFTYCGLEEFEGRYLKCEVKNPDQSSCPDFSPRVSNEAPHACASCRHNRPPLGDPVRVLEATFRRYGQRSTQNLDQEIRNIVLTQAEGEYQDCVDQAGFLATTPAFLPLCTIRRSADPDTGEQRWIVGPVVNTGARCAEWSPGQGPSGSAESAYLDALVAHVRGIVSQADAVSMANPWQVGATQRIQANAEAAIVARCLTMLGASPDHIEAVCNTFTEVFGETWDPQISAQIEAAVPNVTPPTSQPGRLAGSPDAPYAPRIREIRHELEGRGRSMDAETARGLDRLERGEIEAGQQVLREASANGSSDAYKALKAWIFGQSDADGLLLWIAQEPAGERREFLKRALPSVADGARINGLDLIRQGNVEEGERLLRRASDAGDQNAFSELSSRLFQRRDIDGLRRWILEEESENRRVRLETDMSSLQVKQALEFIEQGERGAASGQDVEVGLGLLQDLARAGADDAMEELVKYYAGRGAADQAAFWTGQLEDYRASLDERNREDSSSMHVRGLALIEEGKVEAGERLLLEASDQGSRDAFQELVRRLSARNDVWALQRWTGKEYSSARLDVLNEATGLALIRQGEAQGGSQLDVDRGLLMLEPLADNWRRSPMEELVKYHDRHGHIEEAASWRRKLEELDEWEKEEYGEEGDHEEEEDEEREEPAVDEGDRPSVEQPDVVAQAILDFGLGLIARGEAKQGERFVRQAADEGFAPAQEALATLHRRDQPETTAPGLSPVAARDNARVPQLDVQPLGPVPGAYETGLVPPSVAAPDAPWSAMYGSPGQIEGPAPVAPPAAGPRPDPVARPPAEPRPAPLPPPSPSAAEPQPGAGQAPPAFLVQQMGSELGPYGVLDLQAMAKAGQVLATTLVRRADGVGGPTLAGDIPGVFSDRNWSTAVLLSFFVGFLGIDRFYLGYTALGILKLITLGLCGIWVLIDVVLIAMGQLPDSRGLPLRRT